MKSAVAGAITTASAQRASSMCPIAASAAGSHRSVRTGRPETAWNVSGGDELAGARSHHDLHFGTALHEATHQIGALVRGDAARDAQQDAEGLVCGV